MANKYIIIPDYKPLYAMRYCFGPTHGPLEKPCPTPIDVIGKLLLQSGNEKLNIFEVKVDPVSRKTIGDPVKLTLNNYKKSYDEIILGKIPEIPVGKTITQEVKSEPVVVTPIKKEKEKENTEDSVVVTPEKEEPLVETTLEEKIEDIPEVEPDEIDVTMIKKAEEVNDDVITPLDDVKVTDIEDLPVETVDNETYTVTTDVSTVKYEAPVEVPFTSGYIAPADEDIITSTEGTITITSTDTETYKVPVTTSEGTKYVDTGMSESEYKNLSKSERRKLRKSLSEENERE